MPEGQKFFTNDCIISIDGSVHGTVVHWSETDYEILIKDPFIEFEGIIKISHKYACNFRKMFKLDKALK